MIVQLWGEGVQGVLEDTWWHHARQRIKQEVCPYKFTFESQCFKQSLPKQKFYLEAIQSHALS